MHLAKYQLAQVFEPVDFLNVFNVGPVVAAIGGLVFSIISAIAIYLVWHTPEHDFHS